MFEQVNELLPRKIIISQEIDNVIASQVIEQIIAINDLDSAMATTLQNYTPAPIEIFINSGGGSATDGFAIIGAMEMSDTPIITYGMGLVASMALGIFVKGDVRIASRHTRFMYHSVSYGSMGYIKDHEDTQVECNILQKMYNSLFEDTLLTKETMSDIREKKSNYFFSAKKGKELGIVDDIIKKRPRLMQIVEEPEEDNDEIHTLKAEL